MQIKGTSKIPYRLIINPIVYTELRRYYEFLSSFLIISTFSEVSRSSSLIFLAFSAHNYFGLSLWDFC